MTNVLQLGHGQNHSNSRVRNAPVVAARGAVGIELALADASGAVPAVVAVEDERGGLVREHLRALDRLHRKGEIASGLYFAASAQHPLR